MINIYLNHMRFWKPFPFYAQPDAMDCGPTCLRMVLKFYGRHYQMETLRRICHVGREGVSMKALEDAANEVGLRTMAARMAFDKLDLVATPFIVHWNAVHYVVVYEIGSSYVRIADPALARMKISHSEFIKNWLPEDSSEGIVLLFEKGDEFENITDDKHYRIHPLRFLSSYLSGYRKHLLLLLFGLLAGSLLQLLFPFLTQEMVDTGIRNNDLGFISLLLAAQLALFAGRAASDVIRTWMLLHISSRVNIVLLSDFIRKLMRLPMSFFDNKQIGDFFQRIVDHNRIESFMTGSLINTLFSAITLFIFSIVLILYHPVIFYIFLGGSLIAMFWIMTFHRKRAELDNERFYQLSLGQTQILEFVEGMQDVKIGNLEEQKKAAWEKLQARIFRINNRHTSLEQLQQTGSQIINELKNIVIVYVAARAVIGGEFSLGTMMAIIYVVGQLNTPVTQLVGFVHALQDLYNSVERIREFRSNADEDEPQHPTRIPEGSPEIILENVSFRYGGSDSAIVLDNISCVIPSGKVTAIVGGSGSGKTTLIKMLLRFYKPVSGTIKVGNVPLNELSGSAWRRKCGVVLQDGYLFADTIAKNIAPADETPSPGMLNRATELANIGSFIKQLPLGFMTRLGAGGAGFSQGQRQRLLIARAIYKDPDLLLLDEATSALDTTNERVIQENLQRIFKGKTTVIVAHRLSTVRNADKIIVLDKGTIAESGTHQELTTKKGVYFQLIRNQLELAEE